MPTDHTAREAAVLAALADAWKTCDYTAVRNLTEELKTLRPVQHDAKTAASIFGR